MSLFCKFLFLVRSNITVFTVIFLLGFVSIINYSSRGNLQTGSILFSHLEGKGGSEENETIVINNSEEFRGDANAKDFTPVAKIASADPNFMIELNKRPEEDDAIGLETNISQNGSFTLFNGTAFIAPGSYYDESFADQKYGITKYKVKAGDTPSSIATSFGISTYTVLWSNNLKVGDYIKPNQELEILPVTGVKHTVKAGDTAETIAAKYKADKEEIIMFNALQADGLFPDGSEGKMLIIPNGELAAPLKPKPVVVIDTNPRSNVISSAKYKPTNLNPQGGHQFPYGQCTWYVASKVYVPWRGDAKMWLTNSKAYGYKSGRTPVVGSIMVTTENARYGHVALVEAINGDNITISEMNYVGWGRTSVRVLKANSPVIRGYIYMK